MYIYICIYMYLHTHTHTHTLEKEKYTISMHHRMVHKNTSTSASDPQLNEHKIEYAHDIHEIALV
jgi:hypothetical protein